MESYMFSGIDVDADSLVVEGWHKPSSLTVASGAWIQSAGSAVLDSGTVDVKNHDQWIWIAVEAGKINLLWEDQVIDMEEGNMCVLPSGEHETKIELLEQSKLLWQAFEGPLAPNVVTKLGALIHMPLKQTALPSLMYLAGQTVQVMVRHSGTGDATFQLQHLMYGMLASHWGQPVAMDAMLSHEIAKVVDTLRASQYKENLSLAEMAAISRMPMETFRKRFVSEVGMPPLSYVLHCKMERAKSLLQEQKYSVREVGAEVGMADPYHFSKQFKNIVGISPSAFMKQANMAEKKK